MQSKDKPNRLHQFVPRARSFLFGTKLRTIITIAILCLLGFFIWRNTSQKKSAVQYQTATVERGSVISSLTESGNVSLGSSTNVTSPTDGVIADIYVKNGDEVTQGENLFKVHSTATPQQQSSAYANYLAAQNNLNAAKSKMNSLQSALFKANQAFVTDKGVQNPDYADPKYIEENADWQQAEADYTNQQGVIQQSEAALTSASLAYAATQDAVVTAPTDGTVANLSVAIGAGVSAASTTTTNTNSSSSSTSSSSGGSTVLVLGNLSNLVIKASVNEVDIPKVKSGQKATVTLDAFPDQTYVGTVDSVDTIGTNSSGVVTYNVYITLVAPPASIKPGMTASAVIQIDRHDDVLSVPTSAVQTLNGSSYVRVMKNGKVTQVPVETGISSDTDTEITSGLSEGDTVVTSVTTPTAGGTSTGTSPFSGLGGRGFGGGFGGNATFRAGGGAGGARGGTTRGQ